MGAYKSDTSQFNGRRSVRGLLQILTPTRAYLLFGGNVVITNQSLRLEILFRTDTSILLQTNQKNSFSLRNCLPAKVNNLISKDMWLNHRLVSLTWQWHRCAKETSLFKLSYTNSRIPSFGYQNCGRQAWIQMISENMERKYN